MNNRIRLFRKPLTSLLWLLLSAAVSAFLLSGLCLWISTSQLARSLDASHTAIAVRTDEPLTGEPRRFTQADKAFLEAMEEVKAVRSHTISAAASPSFTPLVEIDRFQSFSSKGSPLPYCHGILMGQVQGRYISRDMLYVYFEGLSLLMGEEYIRGEVEKALNYQRYFTVAIHLAGGEDAKDFFQTGDVCIVSGYLDPGIQFSWHMVDENQTWGHHVLFGGFALQDGEILKGYPPLFENEPAEAAFAEAYAFPLAQRLGGRELWDAYEGGEDLRQRGLEALAGEIWKDYLAAWEKQQHSLPVVGTERLETVYSFLTNRAFITEGRSFTEEEYASGAKVLILSEKMAARQNLKVGDKLTLQQYHPLYGDPGGIGFSVRFSPGHPKSNPTVDLLRLNQSYEQEEEFTLVGIYSLSGEWGFGTYDFTPNTVFMPRRAQIAGAIGEIPPAEEAQEDIYGIELSVELKNGLVNDFMLKMDKSPYVGQFYAFDQGYEEVQKGINSMAESMQRLFLLSAAAFVLFLLLYLLMFQGAEKKTLGTLRSLGNSPARTGAYLFGGGFIIAAGGVLIATLAGGLILHRVQEKILADALAGIDTTARGSSLVLGEEAFARMVRETGATPKTLMFLGAAELVLIALLLALHAWQMARRNPRRLMEG